jgi:hypothetical protein
MMKRYGMADCDKKLHRLQQLTYRVDADSNPIPQLPWSPQSESSGSFFLIKEKVIYKILMLI